VRDRVNGGIPVWIRFSGLKKGESQDQAERGLKRQTVKTRTTSASLPGRPDEIKGLNQQAGHDMMPTEPLIQCDHASDASGQALDLLIKLRMIHLP